MMPKKLLHRPEYVSAAAFCIGHHGKRCIRPWKSQEPCMFDIINGSGPGELHRDGQFSSMFRCSKPDLTPSAPPRFRPYITGRPIATRSAPLASALKTCCPRRTPLSKIPEHGDQQRKQWRGELLWKQVRHQAVCRHGWRPRCAKN